MHFLMNELSIHGQFASAADFYDAVESVMEIRQAIRHAGRELFCHQNMTYAQVTADSSMQQVIQGMPREKRQAWIQWLTRLGPYWSDEREHGENEWLETGRDRWVANTGIGEAAFCRLHGIDRELVSFTPSEWLVGLINVRWIKDCEVPFSIDVRNHWELPTVTSTLENLPSPFSSWRSLEEHVRRNCGRLNISMGAFDPLDGLPYAHGAAERLFIRLQLLNTMCGCFDKDGNRTPEGHRLYTEHFTGEKAWFSDSSDGEKSDFKLDMTFPHPDRPGEYLFCTWHGKVKTPQLRIHFSWPIAADTPLYVVYVGPKITKR